MVQLTRYIELAAISEQFFVEMKEYSKEEQEQTIEIAPHHYSSLQKLISCYSTFRTPFKIPQSHLP